MRNGRKDGSEMLTFAQIEKLTGHKRSTLTKAARKGKLKASLEQTPIGPFWRTTLRDVEDWASNPDVHPPSSKP